MEDATPSDSTSTPAGQEAGPEVVWPPVAVPGRGTVQRGDRRGGDRAEPRSPREGTGDGDRPLADSGDRS